MKIISKEHFEQMEMLSKAFGVKSEIDSLFLPEFITSKEINQMIILIERPTETDFKKILDLIKKTDKEEHFGGSMWHDYKIHLNALLRENGFNSNIV